MPGDKPLQSIQRAIQILYAVAGVENGCTIQQIAARTGLKANTAYKFTRTLERENLLLRKKSPLRFTLGRTIDELKQLNDERHLLSVAGKLLVKTQAALPCSTFSLLELQQSTTYQRLSVQSNRPGVLVQRRDYAVPLYTKASSLLFLAYSHPDEAQKFYDAHPFEINGKPVWKTQANLDAFLAGVRKRGYCQPEVPDIEGPHFRVAAPVFSQGHELVAAIGAFIMVNEPKKYRPQLIQLCRKIGEDISAALKG